MMRPPPMQRPVPVFHPSGIRPEPGVEGRAVSTGGVGRAAAGGLGLLLAVAPSAAQACAVCFGRTDSRLGEGMNWGILSLLAILTGVLGAICLVAWLMARRARAVAGEAPEDEGQTAGQD